ncbi:MAG: hypothetical protein PVJ67_03535 [Candidatus Pacearchaeota archaeon]|jgi:hypothetical protein
MDKKGANIILIFILFIFIFSIVSATDAPLLIYRQKALVAQDKIELSHDFSVSLFGGSASYSYPLEIPEGVNGLKPNVQIFYNHQKLKDPQTFLGSGWVLAHCETFGIFNLIKTSTLLSLKYLIKI